jgi:7-keto-8-aminopelargonate synthetase-like enzyme
MPLGDELRFVERTKVRCGGRTYLFFAGTDYHRLSSHPEVLRALAAAAASEGLSCAGSRITTGNHPLCAALEARAARFLGAPGSALCGSGYLSNTVALECLREDFQRFFLQEGAHPSLADPARGLLPSSRVHRFREPEDLVRDLKRRLCPGERPLVLSDGVVSGTGALPPLAAYWEAVREFEGRLLVDDSHGIAVVGRTGRGGPEAAGLPPGSFIQSGTFSKGFGTFGGLVAGSGDLRALAAERSHAFVGATPVPPPLAAAALAAIEVLEQQPELIRNLQVRARAVHARMEALGFQKIDSEAPIVSLTFRDARGNRAFADQLRAAEIYPPFINYPGGPAGGHFRFTFSSAHTDEEVERLMQVIERAV